MRLIALLFSVLCASGYSQAMFSGAAAAASGPTIILSDGFEETSSGGVAGSSTDGFDSPLVSTWFSSKPNPDWTPAMEGSQELQYTNGQDVRYVYAAPANEVWGWFMYSNNNASVNCEICEVDDSSGNTREAISCQSGNLQVLNGGVAASTSATMAANTVYWILFHYKNDGSGSVEFQSTSTMTGSGTHFASVTGGTGATAVQRFDPICTAAANTNYMDHLRLAITNPGFSLP